METDTLVADEDLSFEFDDDPDNPVEDRGFTGKLTVSAIVDILNQKISPSYGATENRRIIDLATKFFEKYGYTNLVWYLEAEAANVKWVDGNPVRSHEMLKLRSKDGRKLGSNQAHAKLAALFLEGFGVTASYAHVGEPNSAIGRTFDFGERIMDLGRGYTKPIRLTPLAIYDEGYVYDGEVRVITPKAKDGEGAPEDGGLLTGLPTEAAIALLAVTLDGKTPAEMTDAIMDEPALQGTVTLFGVPVLEASADESLKDVLVENHVMTFDGVTLHRA